MSVFKYTLSEVRNKEEAAEAFFLAYFKEFGVKIGGCRSCQLESKYNELIRKQKNMTNTEIKVKSRFRETIFTYRDKKTNRPIRRFGRNMSKEFVDGFKENSTKEEFAKFAEILENAEVAEKETTKVVELNAEISVIEQIEKMSVADATKLLVDLSDEDLLQIAENDSRESMKKAVLKELDKR